MKHILNFIPLRGTITFQHLVINHWGISSAIHHLWIRRGFVNNHHVSPSLLSNSKRWKSSRCWSVKTVTSYICTAKYKHQGMNTKPGFLQSRMILPEQGVWTPWPTVLPSSLTHPALLWLISFFSQTKGWDVPLWFKIVFLAKNWEFRAGCFVYCVYYISVQSLVVLLFCALRFLFSGVTLKPLWFFFSRYPTGIFFLLHLRSDLFFFWKVT